ncbi:unnamed protein product [Adineta steineri]|uniref:F-box domain-containing protein n=1 Tax=Adineta steineri TaxID=433720 RepID=A0A818J141_9BILA|nr:unnamed protein product [Adineta steineri]CAF3533884.1 unnamed protein product [Adineta steineri]
MNQIKRELRFNRFYYKTITFARDKVDTDVQTTSIENLSNEIFYEIFDYLDGCDVYHAFLNLNQRFQQLVKSSSYLLKIKFRFRMSKKQHMNKWKQFIILNKQQIFSIDVCPPSGMDRLCTEFTINSTFSRLESLVLWEIHSDQIMSLLIELPFVPRLFSLTIERLDHLEDLTNIYQMVFTLPLLKYFKFTIYYVDTSISLSPATLKQFSTIEYMHIHHPCTFEQLSNIVSYTPHLCQLDFSNTYEIDSIYETILPLTLSNLTYLRICISSLFFDEFEIFIRRIDSKLKVLCVTITMHCVDSSYRDGDQWEEIIIEYLPHLEKFSLEIYEDTDDYYSPPVYTDEPIEFNSSFWIEREMIVNITIDYEFNKYSIQPLKKRWYEDTQDKIINSSTEHSQSNRLTLNDIPYKESYEVLIEKIYHVSFISQICHVEIPYDKIFIGLLIQILGALPQLISLKLHSLSINKPRKLSSKEMDILSSIKNTSQIKYVYFQKMIKIEDIDFLMRLCPSMVYLKIDYANNINVEIFVRNILKKMNCKLNEHLRLLCFHIPVVDDEMAKKFENMINSEKLLVNYTIQRGCENVYLQWK